MKSFTEPQKKWAMATALLLVLGFNYSTSKHAYEIASADFASSSDDILEDKFTTAQGVVHVKYIKSGDNEVLAVVPKMTEAGFCMDGTCGSQTIALEDMSFEKNKDNVDNITVALLKKVDSMKKSGVETPKEAPPVAKALDGAIKPLDISNPPAATASAPDQDAPPSKEDQLKKKLHALARSCERDNQDDNAAHVDCLTDGTGDLIGRYAQYKISPNIFRDFVADEVTKAIHQSLDESRKIKVSSTALYERAKLDWNARQQYNDLPENMKIEFAAKERSNTLLSVEKLMAKIPKEYENVRAQLLVAQIVEIHSEAVKIQNTRQEATQLTTVNPQVSLAKKWEAQYRTEDLRNLQTDMSQMDNLAWNAATQSSYMDSATSTQYYTLFDGQTTPIISGMISNPMAYQVPPLSLNGSVNPSTASGNYTPRLAPGGRGVVAGSTIRPTVPPPTPSVAGRTGAPTGPLPLVIPGSNPGMNPGMVNPGMNPGLAGGRGVLPLPGTAGAPALTSNPGMVNPGMVGSSMPGTALAPVNLPGVVMPASF